MIKSEVDQDRQSIARTGEDSKRSTYPTIYQSSIKQSSDIKERKSGSGSKKRAYSEISPFESKAGENQSLQS